MAEPPLCPPASEQRLGLGFYATATPGLAGGIKTRAEDFVVREISSYPRPQEDGPFTVIRLSSRNWEQHELSERLAERLHLAPHAISWAGTKDRRAVSERLFSYRGPPPEGGLGLRDVELLEVYRARDGLSLGHHYGNAFEIRLDLGAEPPERSLEILAATRSELARLGGFPNFFGAQRFGEVRPVTHLVGQALARGDPAAAVEVYLTWLPDDADALGADARRAYADHHDPARALREFPRELGFERTLLDRLARGSDAARALRALSRELRMLFVHAYQAWLFNRWMSERHRRGLSMVDPSPGDMVLRVLKDGTVSGHDPVPVLADNERECRALVERGGARLGGPLIGFETPAMGGPAGEIVDDLLRVEGIERGSFRLPKTPEIASAGTFRAAWVPLPPIELTSDLTPDAPNRPGVWLGFALPKGSYATVLTREFLKPGAVPGETSVEAES